MLKVASLFSGVGGLDYGFHAEGFEIIFANDFSPAACETYRTNYPSSEGYLKEGDIKKFLPEIPQPFDILIGGFPCQAFSLAGLRKGFDDPRGLEFFSCVTALKTYQPAFFYLENVKGILSHNSGETLKTVLSELESCGYKVHYELFKLSEYGVNQARERVIFFGVNKELSLDPTDLVPAKSRAEPLAIGEVLKQITQKPGEGYPPNHNLHCPKRKLHWIKLLKDGENLKDLSEDEVAAREKALGLEPVRPIPKSMLGNRRLDSKKIAPTMMFGNTCLPIHPTEDRNLSVREAALIQGFPMDFEFKGPMSAQYKQVGNAVPPPFSLRLAKHLKNFLSSK